MGRFNSWLRNPGRHSADYAAGRIFSHGSQDQCRLVCAHPHALVHPVRGPAAWARCGQMVSQSANCATRLGLAAQMLPASGERTSGAKAHIDIAGFLPGMNPRPTARSSFPQPVTPCPFKTRFMQPVPALILPGLYAGSTEREGFAMGHSIVEGGSLQLPND